MLVFGQQFLKLDESLIFHGTDLIVSHFLSIGVRHDQSTQGTPGQKPYVRFEEARSAREQSEKGSMGALAPYISTAIVLAKSTD